MQQFEKPAKFKRGPLCLEVAVDGLPEVLRHDAHHAPGEEDDDAQWVEQLEDIVVDVDLLELEVLGDVADQVGHGGGVSLNLPLLLRGSKGHTGVYF